jgi:hypothetical protein
MSGIPFGKVLSEALDHEDFVVRSEALSLLAGSRYLNPETAMRALRQVDRWGWDASFEFPHLITELPISQHSMSWLADRMEHLAPNASDLAARELMHLTAWFCKAPVSLIRPHMDRFMETLIAELPPKTGCIRSNPIKFAVKGISFDLAERRLEAAHIPIDQCLERLERCLHRCAASTNFPPNEIDELSVLCEGLGVRGAISLEKLTAWLDAVTIDPRKFGSFELYRGGAALLILKHGHQVPSIDTLLKLYQIDWDWYNEEISEVLFCAGNSTTLQILLEKYPELPWDVRLHLTGVFEKLRFPKHEAALIEIAANEPDGDLRADLGHTLVIYGSEATIPMARKIAKELPEGGERDALIDALCIYDLLAGEATAKTRRHLEQMRQDRMQSRTNYHLRARDLSPMSPAESTHAALDSNSILQFVRPKPIVGRNDLCPCGSGKKFKKCCG